MKFLSLFLASIVASNGLAAEWPQFRGPLGSGAVHDSGHPTQWNSNQADGSADEQSANIAWSTEIPGGGWSSPVVVNDRVFITTAVSKESGKPKGFGDGVASMRSFSRAKAPEEPVSFEVHCLSLSGGELIWKKVISTQKPPYKIHPSNSYATESPAADAERVFAYFASIGVLACLDHDGNESWKREFGASPTANDLGTGSSLAIHRGRVFVQCDNQQESFLCAIDASSGEDLWRCVREGKTSWSSPIVWQNKQRAELVVCGAGDVTSYDPETGDELWKLTGTGGAFSASPTADEHRIYFGNSGRTSRGPLVAIEAGASGDLDWDSPGSPNGIAWSEPSSAPGMSSPVVADGRLYVLSRGIISCHDAESGKRLFRERLSNASRVASSLWAADGMVFVLDESGKTSVIEVADEFKLVSTNSIDDLFWSTPSIANRALLIRGANALYCVRNSE